MRLSILCVTRAEPCVLPLLTHLARDARDLRAEMVISCDGRDAVSRLSAEVLPGWTGSRERGPRYVLHSCLSQGYVESVLDQAIVSTHGDYILRIDDDESISPAMLAWLLAGAYESHPNWSFPRQHLWRTSEGAIGHLDTPHHFPDYQTRLSTRALAGGRHGIHQGSVHGMGEIAPVCVVHHKYLVRSYADRLRIARGYDAYHEGYGTGDMRAFSLPEDVYPTARLCDPGEGHAVWRQRWSVEVDLREGLDFAP